MKTVTTVGTVVRIIVRQHEHILFVQSKRTAQFNMWELPGGKP